MPRCILPVFISFSVRSFRSTFVSVGSVVVAPHQNYKEKDAGKVVLYSTSMGIVRETYAKCANVKQILRTLLVKFEERDIFMSGEYQQEIKDRMQSMEIKVPQLFVDGQHIGVSTRIFLIFSIINLWARFCQKEFRFCCCCVSSKKTNGVADIPFAQQ